MQKVDKIFIRGEKLPQFSVGPIPLRPGPTFPIADAEVDKEVIKSIS